MTDSDSRAELLHRFRAISDPVRIDLIDVLMSGPPATSTQLGRMVPAAKGALRWHLKQLSEAGFVRAIPDTEPVVWEATRLPVIWSPDEKDPAVLLAVAEFDRVRTDSRRQRLAAWSDARYERPWSGTAWPEASISRDWTLPNVRVEDLERLDERIVELLREFRDQTSDDSSEPGETVFVTVGAFPWRPPGR